MRSVAIGGTHLRVADPDWADPLDPMSAARGPGQRWNPPGLDCLYLNADRDTARANVVRLFDGLPYGPDDLDPATAPVLLSVTVPAGTGADAFTAAGLADLGLPAGYPIDAAGQVVPHATCQPLGRAAFDAGLDGVDARSAAPGGGRELAWFPRGHDLAAGARETFDQWW